MHEEADLPFSFEVTYSPVNQSLTSIPEETSDEVFALNGGVPNGKAINDDTTTHGDNDDDSHSARCRRTGKRKPEDVETGNPKHRRRTDVKKDVEGEKIWRWTLLGCFTLFKFFKISFSIIECKQTL